MKKTDNPNRYFPYISLVTTIAFIVFAYLMLPVRNSYMLKWYEEMSFFDSSMFFFRQSLFFPGGLLNYAGGWLTQFMYYPILGSTLLIGLWVLMAWLTNIGFRLSKTSFPFAFIVPLIMLVSVVQMDEAWMSIKLIGYMYSNTLGYLFVIASVCGYRLLKNYQYAVAAGMILIVGCYFFAGYYALFAGLIGVIFMVADGVRSKRYVELALAPVVILEIFLLPNLYYSYFQPTTVDNDFLFLKGLPDLMMASYDKYLWMPFIVASAFLLLLASISAIEKISTARWMMWISLGAMCICGIWCVKADKKNEQLRATVLMLHHLENNDWAGITTVMSRIKEPPNYTMRVLNNFALKNLGYPGEDLSIYKPRNIDPRHAEGFSMTAFINVPMNYYSGNFMLSYRWGMEHSVQYGKRVFFLKYMVKDALLNGEIKLAKRYNDLLLRTRFHRKWAEDMNRYIENPSLIGSNIEFKSILDIANKK